MDGPWLILRRVVHVAPPGAHHHHHHADAEEHAAAMDVEAHHAAVGEAEEHAAAMDVEAHHVAVGEAEEHAAAMDVEAHHVAAGEAVEHVAAVDAEAEAHEGHAAVVGDAQAQAQHAAAGEAAEDEEDPQAQLEESVVNVNTDAAESELAHAARVPGAEPDFIFSVAPPLRVSSLIAGLSSHPDAGRPDMYPYIIAAGRFCLLAHFSIEPYYGTDFSVDPSHSHLVVVRHFSRADGQVAACVVRVPPRPHNFPALANIECVGLVCNNATGDYKIAELEINKNCLPTLIIFNSAVGAWWSFKLPNPLDDDDHLRWWRPHVGTVTINSTVLWYDLSWGMISCDLNQQPPDLDLVFHRLPHGSKLRRDGGVGRDLHSKRCIAVSQNLVRYVEIIPADEAPTVNMWYRDVEDNPRRWHTNYRESFKHIWDHESYGQTGLPKKPPVLVGVSPVNSNVVYFSLNQRLFSVNVPEHTVVDWEEYEPLNRPGPPDEADLDTSRYLITWNLDADGAKNVGHNNPDEYSDHDDSSDNGSMDEGEIEDLSPQDSDQGDSSSSNNGSQGTMEEGELDYQSPQE